LPQDDLETPKVQDGSSHCWRRFNAHEKHLPMGNIIANRMQKKKETINQIGTSPNLRGAEIFDRQLYARNGSESLNHGTTWIHLPIPTSSGSSRLPFTRLETGGTWRGIMKVGLQEGEPMRPKIRKWGLTMKKGTLTPNN